MARQSSIIAFIIVGIIAGVFREQVHIPQEFLHIFTEIGIILLLFMAGLEIDFHSLKKRWALLLGNGLGQIILYVIVGAALGYLLLGLRGTATLIYFGLCLTLSSTIIVLGYLKAKRAMGSLHGQIILGLMVLQDITAVLALVILSSLSGEGSLLVSVGVILAKMIILGIVLFTLSKFVLGKLFRYLAASKELLFVASLGFALGVAALCSTFDFSPEIGAFMAGAALSILPYKLEIQDKVEPMKDFGVILFFVSLGYGLHFDSSTTSLILPVLVVAVFVVFTTPALMLLLGFLHGLKSRPSFMIGFIVNQISEFSLILATLCRQAGVFDDRVFFVVTLATVGTIFLSNIGHQLIERLYAMFKRPLSFIDRHSRARREAQLRGFELKDHVVVIEYNELAERIIDCYVSAGKHVLLIDIDPDVIAMMQNKHDNLACMYADIYDPDTREEAGFEDASAIISCLVGGQEAEIAILHWLSDGRHEIPFIAATDSSQEALELYRKGATYVMQTEELAAQRFGEILAEYGTSLSKLKPLGQKHQANLKKASAKLTFRFT